MLVPRFEQQSGIAVKVIAVGTARPCGWRRAATPTCVLVHAPAAERPYVEAGDLIDGRVVMHNDFVIVGPA